MNTKLFIPKICKVGFNLRSDTYTGKLGYVIYHDGKKWRKEPSWESWREKYISIEEYEIKKKEQYDSYLKNYQKSMWNEKTRKHEPATYEKVLAYLGKYDDYDFRHGVQDETIKPIEFDNVPTEGFVLNKKAGGNSWGWNPRQTYCRVYDPRGFEFEITIPNLLFILQESNCMKGKGLEGKFIYSWHGKDIVLLPVQSEEYQKCTDFTKLQDGKLYKKDMIEGCIYETNQKEKLIYIGHMKYVNTYKWRDEFEINSDIKKKYVFCQLDEDLKKEYFSWTNLTSLTTIKRRKTNEPVGNYAHLMDEFINSKNSTKNIKEIKFISIDNNYLSKIDNCKHTIYKDKKKIKLNKNGSYYSYNNNNRFYIEDNEISKNELIGNYLYKVAVYNNGKTFTINH
jgi:hypothetical protein